MQKILFHEKGEDLQLRMCTIPQHASITEDPDSENHEQIVRRQEIFLTMPKNIKHKLASSETGKKIQAIGQKYGFELLRLANITRLIREYYFGEVRFENFPSEIEKRMGVSLLTAQEITRYLKQEIIDWDPWAEYLAKLPKLPIREIAQKHPKIAEMEITKGYIELKGSDDLEDPSIKNWLKDYISHLGYDRHSQMQRAEYLFHSENGKGLDSQDREKLGIILKSFDENVPLPVDEENEEIVFDGLVNESRPKADQPMAGASKFVMNAQAPRPQPTPIRQESFIKPYNPVPQPQRQAPPPQPRPVASVPANFASQTGKEEINKYFSAPESPDIPGIKIHSITEHNESRVAPQPNIQRPASAQPQRSAQRPISQQTNFSRPQHRIIEPFGPKMIEPRLDGNIVDLSERE